MTALEVDDLAVVTGPMTYCNGKYRLDEDPDFCLIEGEVVSVLEAVDDQGDVFVRGHKSGEDLYITATSLTPLSEIQSDPEVQWGDLLDPNYVHDYVWDGSE